MGIHEHYAATLAEGSAVPTLLCGHCRSTLSRARIFRNVRNEGNEHYGASCRTIGLCSADDCGAVNCCDTALAQLDNPDCVLQIAS